MGCVRRTRNGVCQGRRLNYRVGPKNLTLCNRHLKVWEEDRDAKMKRVEYDHAQGLHGTGDERKQFAEQYEAGEFWLRCYKCRDEIAGDELGVSPDNVQQALTIKAAMERAERNLNEALTRFNTQFLKDPVYAITNYADDVKEYSVMVDLYKTVTAQISEDMDLVAAYDYVKAHVEQRLIGDQYHDDEERRQAAKFVRGSAY